MELKRETIPVVLFQGDDLVKIEALQATLATSLEQQTGNESRLASDTSARDAAEAYDAFVAEAETRAVTVNVQALKRSQWRSLEDKHPPRLVKRTVKDEDGTEREVEEPHEDDAIGFNVRTMADDLVSAAIAPGQFATPADQEAFLEDLSDPNFSKLYSAAVSLNTQGRAVPKAGAVSLLDRISAATSKSPEVSA